jgi:hypothetical protein
MYIVESIGLQDVGPFEKVQFDIPQGLSVVYGLNRASGRKSRNSNGVGKSLLLASLADTFNDEPIVGERGDRLRTGTRAVRFIPHGGKKTVVRRSTRGKTEKIDVFEDGVDQKIRTIPQGKEFLSRAWPLTTTEYTTFVHLDARIPHPLVMGTSAARKEFFTSFFGLDRLDAERKLYEGDGQGPRCV